MVSRKPLAKEKFEYFHYNLIKWADIFIVDKGVFVAHMYKRNIVKKCFEIFTTDFSKALQSFSSYVKPILELCQHILAVYD